MQIHPDVRSAIITENIPKNMHPVHNVERRKCRTKTILKNHGAREGVLFVDAARYPRNLDINTDVVSSSLFAMAVVDTKGKTVTTGSERWLSALTSSELQEQLWAIQRARAAVERLCLTAHNARVA
ncbi:hypothetical protein HPB52_014489 [Rhipicephalus sanguineus]|uniref:Tick transposon n=1 Tax=Rhipicephalus sanguineus TaxID=34632 RepID=A0A9D4QF70_RHISA|nr:hypothetical protein HPB52_014489 [Rhipicephalus sanguineus]